MRKQWRSIAQSPALDFAHALYAARKALNLDHRELADTLGVSTRTMVRWESGRTLPREYARDPVIQWAGTLRQPLAEPVLRSLGVMMPDETTGAANSEDLATARIFLDHAVLSAAEAHGIAPRALRGAVVAVLEAARKAHVSMAMAISMLAPAAPAEPSSPVRPTKARS